MSSAQEKRENLCHIDVLPFAALDRRSFTEQLIALAGFPLTSKLLLLA